MTRAHTHQPGRVVEDSDDAHFDAPALAVGDSDG